MRAPAALALVTANFATIPQIIEPLASALLADDTTTHGMVTYFLDAPGRCAHLVLSRIFAAVEQHGERLARGGLALDFRWIDCAGRPELEEGLRHPNAHVRWLCERGLTAMRGRR